MWSKGKTSVQVACPTNSLINLVRGGIWPAPRDRRLPKGRRRPQSGTLNREGRGPAVGHGSERSDSRWPGQDGCQILGAFSAMAEKSGEGSVCPDARPHQLSSPLFRPLNLTRPKGPVRVFHDESLWIAHQVVTMPAQSSGNPMGRTTGHP
jgi:hypothetical protein